MALQSIQSRVPLWASLVFEGRFSSLPSRHLNTMNPVHGFESLISTESLGLQLSTHRYLFFSILHMM